MPDLDSTLDDQRTADAEDRGHGDPEKRLGNLLALWFGMLGAPTAWIIGLALNYALVEVACDMKSTFPLHLGAAMTLLVAAGGTWVAFRQWQRLGWDREVHGGGGRSRSAFMAAAGVALSALFMLAILAQWLGVAFLHPCMGV